VPVHGAAETEDGTIVVPDKDWFKLAPAAGTPGAATRRRELETHYAR
jgi:hypothetical protein